MPDLDLIGSSPLDGWVQPGRFGKATGDPGIVVGLGQDLALASVMARQGRRADLLRAFRHHFGVEPPMAAQVQHGPMISLVGVGPDHWLALSSRIKGAALRTELIARLPDMASVCDQSDGRLILHLRGPRVRDVLAKGVPVDLHPGTFGVGAAASTIIRHVEILLWQVDDEPTYCLAVPRSFALSLWRWLEKAAAEVGLEYR